MGLLSESDLRILQQRVAAAESFESRSDGLLAITDFIADKQPSVLELFEFRVPIVLINIIVNSNNVYGRQEDLSKAVWLFKEILTMKNPSISDVGIQMDGLLDKKRIEKFVALLETDDRELFDNAADCLMTLACHDDALRTRIRERNFSGTMLKLLGRLDRPKFVPKAVELIEVVVRGSFRGDFTFAILTLIEHLSLDEKLDRTPEHTRRLIPVLSQAINDGWQRNPSFVIAACMLKELLKKDGSVADAVHAAGLVELCVGLLDEDEQIVLIPVLEVLRAFASVSNKECDILLQKGILTKVSRIMRLQGSAVDKCLLFLEAVSYKVLICTAAQLHESKLLETLEMSHNSICSGDIRTLLVAIARRFLTCLEECDRRRLTKRLSEHFQELLSVPSPQ